MSKLVSSALLLLIILSHCGMVYAGSINRVDSSPKQMAMAGAGSAQVNDSTAMALNPAGMAINDLAESDTMDFFLGYGEALPYQDSPEYESADMLGIFWAKRYWRWTVGVGMYDTGAFNLDYQELIDNQVLTKNTHVSAYDMALYLAFNYSDKLKLGSTLKMSSLSSDYKDSGGNSLDDEVWSIRLGAKYILFDQPIDFTSSSMQLAWQFAAGYEPESEFTPFSDLRQHPLKNRDITGAPELFLLGSTMRFGWIFENFSFVMHLNADVSQETYSGMSDLLIPSEALALNRQDVVIHKTMLGSEWLFKGTAPDAITYALRAGISDQRSNFEGELEEQKASIGFAFIGHGASLELAAQTFLDNDGSRGPVNDGLSWSLGFGLTFY
jgi:hypothetical protein